MNKKQRHHHHLKHCLDRFTLWLNCGGMAADDFRELTDLAVPFAREQKTGLSYKGLLAWTGKMNPIARRIAVKYPTYPIITSSLEPGGQPFFSLTPLRKRLRQDDLEACFAIRNFHELVSAGMLERIRRCEWQPCREYFHGRTGKRFCSQTCMRKHMRRMPNYRKRNAANQRKYYDKYFRKKPLARE